MKKVLEKISWKTRKWNILIQLCNIYINDNYHGWGVNIIKINYKLRSYSLFELRFRLPNKTSNPNFKVDDLDFLFLRTPLYKRWEKLDDKWTWSKRTFTRWEKKQLNILDKLFN